jgi:hypothetical protein
MATRQPTRDDVRSTAVGARRTWRRATSSRRRRSSWCCAATTSRFDGHRAPAAVPTAAEGTSSRPPAGAGLLPLCRSRKEQPAAVHSARRWWPPSLPQPCSDRKSTCTTQRAGRRSFCTACAAASAVSLRGSMSRHSDRRSSLLVRGCACSTHDVRHQSCCKPDLR